MLTREQILAAQELKTDTVEAPEWGGTVIVRELPAAERLAFFADLEALKGTDERQNNLLASALFVCRTVIDAEGKRVFQDEDAEPLTLKNEATLQTVANKAAELNGICAEKTAGN